jgi:FkbM family methyltransferase
MDSPRTRTHLPGDILDGYDISELSIVVPDLPCPVKIRLNDSDAKVFRQVFKEQEYSSKYCRDVKTIIDAGANVGYATLWYRQQFPSARIIAIEPDPTTFDRLKLQCQGLSNVELLNAALWHEDGHISIKRTNEAGAPVQSWGTRTTDVAGDIPAISVSSLMEQYEIECIDIFKIDIEGAELEVFSKGDLSWIKQTRCFAIETHERFKPRSHTTVMNMLSRDFNVSRRGENIFFMNASELGSDVSHSLARSSSGETEPRRTGIWLVGEARSGTTWVGGMIAHAGAYQEYFEPLHPKFSMELFGEPLLKYLRSNRVPPTYEGLFDKILRGKLSNPRVVGEGAKKSKVLIKDIHALMNAKAMSARCPELKVALLVRHPFEVAYSKMWLSNYTWFREPKRFLLQPELVADHLKNYADLLRADLSVFEKYVLIWCVQHYVFFRSFDGEFLQISYKHLRNRDDRELDALKSFIEADSGICSSRWERTLTQRSRTDWKSTLPSHSDVNVTMTMLHGGESIIERFGLSQLVAQLGSPDIPLTAESVQVSE